MAQTRQRQIKVQVISADPAFKVFKGIYADSNHNTLLTPSKTYDFTLNAGQTKELYIRYSPKPVTITFKSNPNTGYHVIGSFDNIGVSTIDVVKNIEFPTDTTPDIVVGFNSVIPDDTSWRISAIKIDGSAHELPYSMEHVTPGTNITFEVETSLVTNITTTSTTTTTSTPAPVPAVLKLQSNAENTIVKVTSDGIDPEEVSLAGTTQSSVVIDMTNAPVVDENA